MSKNDPHILGKESIGKLLLQYSIPAIIGMTITSIYNIIDSIFIGHGVGAMAIAGLAISFPLMNLVVAFCTLVSAGGSTLASIRLGQKDLKGATEILSHTLMLCITNSVFFGILSFIFLDDILLFFGSIKVIIDFIQRIDSSLRACYHLGEAVNNLTKDYCLNAWLTRINDAGRKIIRAAHDSVDHAFWDNDGCLNLT